MSRALLLSVRFYDGRYHGTGDWPPAPARLFQALVAGAASGDGWADGDRAALTWLEALAAPVIAAPAVRDGQGSKNYVPNNDLDAVGGDPRRVGKIRAPKSIKPRLFDPSIPFLYGWRFAEDGDYAQSVCRIAEGLYQLGRGIDMAWAVGEVLAPAELELRLASHSGPVHRPSEGGHGPSLACPQRGSLESLLRRYKATRERFKTLFKPAPTKKEPGRAKPAGQLFTQPPKARFASIAYDSPPHQYLFDLRTPEPEAPFAPWPKAGAAALVENVRDAAAARLEKALSGKQALIERVLVGRNATEADKAARVRIVPLPSIGHSYADHAIRRLLVETPPDCPMSADDVAWGFSGLDLGVDYSSGEVRQEGQPLLVPAGERSMLGHYGVEDGGEGFRLWRTVTPAALPERAARRRIDPGRRAEEAKPASERANEESRAVSAVLHALRHAGIRAGAESIHVQREPFAAKGARAEVFASGTRFAKERLWHVEIAFAEPVRGPLVIGDGRYLGLGLMAPVKAAWRDGIVFSLAPEARVATADAAALLRAVRRALMALSRDSKEEVPLLFSGHETNGAPASSGRHEHVFLAADDAGGNGHIDRLIVAAPWICDRSGRAPHRSDRSLFDRVVSSLREVRAGALGVIALGRPHAVTPGDSLVGPGRTWESRTPYRPTRHAGRGKDVAAAVVQDVIAECGRRGLPTPEAVVQRLSAGPNNGGLTARVGLRFAVAVEGPIMLGRDSHMGGGLFAAVGKRTCAD